MGSIYTDSLAYVRQRTFALSGYYRTRRFTAAAARLCAAVPTLTVTRTRMLQRRSRAHQAAGMARSMDALAC
jgi:hypothetical protein